ncbi:MAG: lysophospholipid acyltransferase family protein [Cyclonatronaceae bacterium]
MNGTSGSDEDHKNSGFGFGDWLRAVIAVPFFVIILIIASVVAVPLFIFSAGRLKNRLIRHVGRFIGMSMLMLLGVRLNIHYGNHDIHRQAVYIINHSSTLDLFIIISLGLPRIRYVAKYELQFNPFFFLLGRLTGQIFIKRSDSIASVSELQNAYERIRKQDLSVMVAPEGSRKHEMPVGLFKKGAFRIAQDLNLPVVPVFIEGAADLCPGDALLSRSGVVHVWFDKPESFYGLSDEEFNLKIEELRVRYISWSTNGYSQMQSAER